MLTIKKKIYLIMRVIKEDILYIFYILLTLIYKIRLDSDVMYAQDFAKARDIAVSYFNKIKRALILEIVYTQNTFINKAENKILLYANSLSPPIKF